MKISKKYINVLQRRLNYLENERLPKRDPVRPGYKYDFEEVQALKAVLSHCAGGRTNRRRARALEEPPRIDEEYRHWVPGE